MKISAALPSVAFRRLARRPADLFAFFNRVRIGAKIYAGFCLVLLLLVMIAGASWLGFQETTSGMGTIQESSDAAITTAVMDGRTAKALYFAQKFMSAGGQENARSEEHTSELQSLMRISYAVLCLQKKNKTIN